MAEGGGYSQHLSQTEEGERQVGNSGPSYAHYQHHHHHTSPHHVSHTSSHSSQGSHPHPHHTVVHGSPVRGGSSADVPPTMTSSPTRAPSGPSHAQQHSAAHRPQAQMQAGTGAGSSSSLSWSNIPLAVNSGDSRTSLDDEGQADRQSA